MAAVFNFTVSNEDLLVRFSCPNHGRRIRQIVRNLRIDASPESGMDKKMCRYTILEGTGTFRIGDEELEGQDVRHEAVFFENTEYPLIVRGNSGKSLSEVSLAINDRLSSGEDGMDTVISEGGELYGSLNFHNQVGISDFTITYHVKGESQPKRLKFQTEVLSYKLDYRSDLRIIISDIEREYAMLSASFLKDTYLSMRRHNGKNNPLIWWQIFKSCYSEIVVAAKRIIDRPKRRLRSVAKYERAERLATLPRELENEYQVHKDNPSYLYRTEELMLSHDTIENRFLKHALNAMRRKFLAIKEHIMTAMYIDDPMRVDISLVRMEDELSRLCNHSFFRGVGVFKGFTQDNLVMKQAHGYKTIFEKWIELQQGYELEEGVRKLEVKDISDLYEIWCFIKVKNIVKETLQELGKEARQMVNGRDVSRDFIPKLVYGGSMSFINEDNVELATVSYNAQVEKSSNAAISAISGTDTMTTVQRPDIVLRLSKSVDAGMKYTYLFDAKYRIDDVRDRNGYDVPPEDAIDQMHRYRDAIYYTEEGHDHAHLKKEVIAGYVLFPGQIPLEALDINDGDYYYQRSNRLIGIGAFPLRPDQERHAKDGSIVIEPNSSELALRKQIRNWLEDSAPRESLLEHSIPQKGLEYSDEPVVKGSYFLSTIDTWANADAKQLVNGDGRVFYSGYTAILGGTDFQKVKYFAPVDNHVVKGYYKVLKIEAQDITNRLNEAKEERRKAGKRVGQYKGFDKSIRICFHLGEYVSLPSPFTYGLDANAAKGIALSRKEFQGYCNKIKDMSDK